MAEPKGERLEDTTETVNLNNKEDEEADTNADSLQITATTGGTETVPGSVRYVSYYGLANTDNNASPEDLAAIREAEQLAQNPAENEDGGDGEEEKDEEKHEEEHGLGLGGADEQPLASSTSVAAATTSAGAADTSLSSSTGIGEERNPAPSSSRHFTSTATSYGPGARSSMMHESSNVMPTTQQLPRPPGAPTVPGTIRRDREVTPSEFITLPHANALRDSQIIITSSVLDVGEINRSTYNHPAGETLASANVEVLGSMVVDSSNNPHQQSSLSASTVPRKYVFEKAKSLFMPFFIMTVYIAVIVAAFKKGFTYDSTPAPLIQPIIFTDQLQMEMLTLIKVFDLLNGDDWVTKTNWKSQTVPVCLWYGVFCDSLGHVDSIVLENNNVVGEWPSEEFAGFQYLKRIQLDWNSLSGPLSDDSISQMKSLSVLQVKNNNFTGTIPANALGQLPYLSFVDLSGNSFSNSMPDGLCNATGDSELTCYVQKTQQQL